MKNFFLLLLLFTGALYAQEDAWVYFTDKPDAAFYLANPLEMLTQKALDRRNAQGIALDEMDVPVHQQYIDGIDDTDGITVKAKSKWLNAVHVRGSQADIEALENLVYVDHVEFANHALNDRIMEPTQTATTQTTLENYNYGGSATQVQMLNAHLLHQQGYTGQGITIAVMDAGFPGVNTTQPFQHLISNNLVLGGYNFVGGSTGFYTGGNHGTKVLSTLAGYTTGQLVGSAPDASYYLFITEDPTSENPVEESYWVEAAEMADSLGVDIISTSLGYKDYDNNNYSYTYADMDGQTAFMSRGAAIAYTRGMLLVTSAGNDGNDAEPHISVPADAFNTLTVGAVDAGEQYAYFSSIGPSADGPVKPDVMAMGLGATYADIDGTIATGNGTSFSAPILAGAVACLWQAVPDMTNAQVMQFVKQSADKYNNPNAQYGYGIPDFSTALAAALGINSPEAGVFAVYPNPATDRVYFTQPANLTLYNTLGQEVLSAQSVLNINIEKLPAGLYSYTAKATNAVITGKIIKQ